MSPAPAAAVKNTNIAAVNNMAASSQSISETVNEIIQRLRADISSGKPWYPALLEAIGRWPLVEENLEGSHCRYLIAGEAFDLTLLSERLLRETTDLVPDEERDAYLFRNRPPLEIPAEEFRQLVGEIKYHQHLNYFYGITVEEALTQVVEEEVRKEEHGMRARSEQEHTEEAYRRIYDRSQKELLREFCRVKGYPRSARLQLGTIKEFFYWLFQLRLRTHEKARSASDTRKALTWLKCRAPAPGDWKPVV
jgi:hypothetical protein